MRGVLAVAVLTVGLGFAAMTYSPDVFDVAEGQLSWTSSPARAATAEHVPDTGRLVEFSPGAGLKLSEPTPQRSWFDTASSEEDRLSSFSKRFADALDVETAPEPAVPTASVELAPWRSAVLVAASGVGPNGTQVASRFLSADQRLKLVTALQEELQRVGCYTGEASGSWNRETRTAIGAFMDRVNAVLPTDEPDYTLLELVKAHPRSTCEASCPDGQSFDAEGRCIPLAVLAQARKPRVVAAKFAVPGDVKRAPVAKAAVPSLEVASVAKAAPFPEPMGLGASGLGTGKLLGAGAVGSQTSGTDYRIADAEADLAATAEARPPVTEPAAAPAPKSKARKSASQGGRRWSNYRHVQHLFEHPLGRL